MTTPALQRADLSAQNPWPGLRAFTENDRDFFFGRERESAELLGVVKRAHVVVLYGQSGLGKTSLLQAGLFPELKRLDFLPFRLRFDHDEEAPSFAQQIKQALITELERAEVNAPLPSEQETLWEYFHRRDVDFWGTRNRLCTPVIVIDQFEEVFTLGQKSERSSVRVTQFAADLESVIEHRPPESVRERLEMHPEEALAYDFQRQPVKFVLSLREDFLPLLDPLRSRMPSLLPHRFRLERMTAVQALAVIERGGRDLVEPEVAKEIVEFVSTSQRKQVVRSMERREVEPALLSVVCEELNRRRLERNQARITLDLLTEEQSGIIQSFYERAFDGIDNRVRDWVEDELLTASGYRDRAAMEDALNLGLPQSAFDLLVDRRVLHREEREGVVWLELTHDLLTDPAAKSRAEREQRLREQAANSREAERNEKLRRTRIVSALMAVLFIVSLSLALYAFFQKRVALQNAEAAVAANEAAKKSLRDANDAKAEALKNLETANLATVRAAENLHKAEDANAATIRALTRAENANRKAEASVVKERAAEEAATKSANDAINMEGTLRKQRERTLTEANDGLEKARQAGGAAYAAMQKANTDDSREAYLNIVEINDNYANTILELDPKNKAALSIKAFDSWFRADTLRKLKRDEEARKSAEDARKFADTLAQSSRDPWTRIIAARTYASVALVMSDWGDKTQEESDLQKALATARDVQKRPFDADYESWHYLGLTYDAAASLDYDDEKWDRSIDEYNQEDKMEQKAFTFAVKNNDVNEWSTTVHNTFYARLQVARIYIRRKEYGRARILLVDNEALAENFLKKLGDKNKTLETKLVQDLWDMQAVHADMLASQKQSRPEAVRAYQAALETGDKALNLDGSLSNKKRREAETLSLARMQTLVGQYPEALASYKKNVSLVQQRAPDGKTKPEDAGDVAEAYRVLSVFEKSHDQKAAALADRGKELEWLSKEDADASVKMEIAESTMIVADLEVSLGRAEDAKGHYAEASRREEEAIHLLSGQLAEDPFRADRNLASAYQDWAFIMVAIGKRVEARDCLTKAATSQKAALDIAERDLAKTNNSSNRQRVRNAASGLGWLELLNNHPEESMRASQTALALDDTQALVKGNLAHAYLFANQVDRARSIYLENRGEEINRDLFELSVQDDFNIFRKLGLERPAMAEIEKALGIQH